MQSLFKSKKILIFIIFLILTIVYLLIYQNETVYFNFKSYSIKNVTKIFDNSDNVYNPSYIVKVTNNVTGFDTTTFQTKNISVVNITYTTNTSTVQTSTIPDTNTNKTKPICEIISKSLGLIIKKTFIIFQIIDADDYNFYFFY